MSITNMENNFSVTYIMGVSFDMKILTLKIHE
jgi:hypothetical protein